ncbi:class I SAM-dependent methyltransferase [Trichlorobacter ammonificans]|uniref:Methyltransferase domain-containing protein n=1 Tax=Trichlorobacter ammonificans TaxID=2916410 RepID=A0ABM9D788_9BACT|nr:class I SAM-dependent methyltransferase [Trichlorobacter ammonificans]CAH2031072.1 protein of unknown function [Trichlorobacter ammonificans]
MLRKLFDCFWNRFVHRPNTIANNVKVWSNWDWSRHGEEWSNDAEWKQSLVDHVLRHYLTGRETLLEIGPGGGRWTEYLAPLARKLVVVDVTPVCIELCKERFSNYSHISYVVNDGSDLSALGDIRFDGIWSWDVFVHIAAADIRTYVNQFARLLNPGGVVVIHHSSGGVNRIGWRSDMTAAMMQEFCHECGLVLERQFTSWADGRFRVWPDLPPELNPDTISVLRKPAGHAGG